jgi:hypothetical protein
MFIDYQELKQKLCIEEAVEYLDLELAPEGNQLRGACTACFGDERSLVITPDKGVFYCFKAKRGGDLLSLAAHIMQVSVKEAAAYLVTCMDGTEPVKEPDAPVPLNEPKEVRTLEPLKHLDYENDAIDLPPDTAQALGVGYAKRGMMRGRVVFPLYREGTLVGYVGYSPNDGNLKLPTNLTEKKVVEFSKRA